MKIKELIIRQNPHYSDSNPDRYVAVIKFESREGNMEVLLTPEVSEWLLGVLGPKIMPEPKHFTPGRAGSLKTQRKA